jgi:hypothetical protein
MAPQPTDPAEKAIQTATRIHLLSLLLQFDHFAKIGE